jgi:predicted acyl esterase
LEQEPYPEVAYRKAAPVDVPFTPHGSTVQIRYEGPKRETKILKKGTVFIKGGCALPCDILWERDVAVKLRDGTSIYLDVFRPPDVSNVPAILSWSPYGKIIPTPPAIGVPVEWVSGLNKFEGPDPAYWCNHEYAVINVDVRGAYGSEGDIHFWGSVDSRDGYDVVEWIASQHWCNGNVGMSGNSWLAIAQWFIAAENPLHLAAIAPWEGVSDLYRQDILRGGIHNIGFNELVISTLRGKNRVEDVPYMTQKYPLMNPYWEDKSAKLENITVPAYVVASWTNSLHSLGTLEGFRRISSREKWLRVHNTNEWYDYYTPENVEDLRRFFDYYLKGIENEWPKTPKVRLCILNPGGTDIINRPENEWPLARTQYRKLFLDAATGTLSLYPVREESFVKYQADNGKSKADFTITFNEDTEITGYLKLHLWVEAEGAVDMDLFVLVQKLDAIGDPLTQPTGLFPYLGLTGWLRVSHREIDPERSTTWLPYHTHLREQLLKPGEIVACDILIWPTGMLWHKGQKLRLTIAGFNPVPLNRLGTPGPKTRNQGYHIIHMGGKFDSYLQIPVIPH